MAVRTGLLPAPHRSYGKNCRIRLLRLRFWSANVSSALELTSIAHTANYEAGSWLTICGETFDATESVRWRQVGLPAFWCSGCRAQHATSGPCRPGSAAASRENDSRPMSFSPTLCASQDHSTVRISLGRFCLPSVSISPTTFSSARSSRLDLTGMAVYQRPWRARFWQCFWTQSPLLHFALEPD